MISDLRLPGTVGDTFIIQAQKWLKERCAPCFTDDNYNEITAPYMGGCQNYGPLLGPLNWAPYEAPYYNRTQTGTIILTIPHM